MASYCSSGRGWNFETKFSQGFDMFEQISVVVVQVVDNEHDFYDLLVISPTSSLW